MTIGFLFWLIWIIWVVFGFIGNPNPGPWGYGRHFVVALLLFLLGWSVFGFPIKG